MFDVVVELKGCKLLLSAWLAFIVFACFELFNCLIACRFIAIFFPAVILFFFYLNRFRFWQWGRWIEIKVDDRLPTRGDRPAHMHCAQPDVYWAALLEKAYAKLYGGYAFLKYGTVGRALQDLTGAVVQSVPPSGPLLGRLDTNAVFEHNILIILIISYFFCVS